MRLFYAWHNPETKRYVPYYSIVLIACVTVVVLTMFQVIHQTPLQNAATFFEGFFSLFMLVRNEKVGNAFLTHMASIRLASKF
ncbi:hypothetical protein NSIN_30241 [Nitrosotalea sinensis]|uniref:Uncharacterized protein n=1 Tax=Nitrosotalea sinensis TaxID=1499975 RepID=A0A2H1EI71_9ARCH|nr:hypothetical protein [Candidatus Nitrosotalea sinensis]SHO46712.1 hypothetical protein NSIN_30241 [Candidatus Nitrosotalea sinensis]